MPLSPGSRLGHYEIVALLGVGGMGEVYRGRDAALNRDVAIKVLPDAFANDQERLARFAREAQTLASLNHPNIAQIFGLDGEDRRALVMELVEGDDLAACITRGPMPLADALPIARQIAEALEAAHDAGIVHRDLKPANVKVRPDGTVKVLDFGLAKAAAAAGSDIATQIDTQRQGLSLAVTSPAMTQAGFIIGTAAYMSPEQARGKSVDKRADIWAFGVVLFEMLTAARAFKGDEISDVLAAVLRQDVNWAALPPGAPPRLRLLLERCLDRDPKTRLRDIGEARLELVKIESGAPDPATSHVPTMPTPVVRHVLAGAIAGAIIAAAMMLYALPTAPPARAPAVRLSFVPPAGVSFESARLDAIAVSPDGQMLAFTGRSADGKRHLYIRALDAFDARLLPGTEEPIKPFWSPDSKSVAFGAQGKLKRVDLAGGAPTILANAPRLNGGSWSRDGVILFVPDYNAGLSQVPASGGAAMVVAEPDASRREQNLQDPEFLPDGRHFLYHTSGGIRWGELSSKETGAVTQGERPRFVAPDRLLFARGGTLFVAAFDAAGLKIRGDLTPLTGPPDEEGFTFTGENPFSVSNTGVLVLRGAFTPDYQLTWFDRRGTPLGALGRSARVAGDPFSPRLSPDGTQVAFQDRAAQAPGGEDRRGIWVIDLQRNLPVRVQGAIGGVGPGQYPQWSNDGRQLAWSVAVDGVPGIYQKAASGLGTLDPLVKSGPDAGGTTFLNDWSRDGRFMLYHTRGERTRIDVWALPLFGDRKPYPVLQTEFDDGPAQVSPDGRWLAYRSDISGSQEIYVQSFIDGKAGGERLRISTNGGSQPRFRPDGQELFYLADDGHLMAVSIGRRGTTFEHSEAKALFKTRTLPRNGEVQWEYDVTRDGQKFVIGTILDGPRATPPAPTIVLNWMSDVKR